jgi:hypothetical protein
LEDHENDGMLRNKAGAAESEVITRAFELLGAFDEVVGLGYRESAVGLVQVRNALEMESHEEKISIIIAQVCIHLLFVLFPPDVYVTRIEQGG